MGLEIPREIHTCQWLLAVKMILSGIRIYIFEKKQLLEKISPQVLIFAEL
jgi:hypothetical protein